MLDKRSYISQVRNQLNDWDNEVRNISQNSGAKAVEEFIRAKHLVENKINEFEITGDEVLGHWETEIDNLRHQAQRSLDSARSAHA